jgi:hypothetical protein
VAARHRVLVETQVGGQAAAYVCDTAAQRDHERLAGTLDLDVATGLSGALVAGLTANALVETGDRVDPLGEPFDCCGTDGCLRGHMGSKPNATHALLKIGEENPKYGRLRPYCLAAPSFDVAVSSFPAL